VFKRPRVTTITVPEPSVPLAGCASGTYVKVMSPIPMFQLSTLDGAPPPGVPGAGLAGCSLAVDVVPGEVAGAGERDAGAGERRTAAQVIRPE